MQIEKARQLECKTRVAEKEREEDREEEREGERECEMKSVKEKQRKTRRALKLTTAKRHPDNYVQKSSSSS